MSINRKRPMNNLKRLRNKISIDIKPDEDGFTGRECPEKHCEGYFKIEFGTGLKGEDLPCHCPYCGHTGPHDHFWTKEQIKYAESKALRQIDDAVFKDLKTLEFNHPARGSFGIGLSMKVKRTLPIRVLRYEEKQLETEILCNECSLRYTVYGVFGYCPDCRKHNSLQILTKNLDLIIKKLDLEGTLDDDLATFSIHDALHSVVASFDGFGRESCRVSAHKATFPDKALNLSFQNLERVSNRLHGLFNIHLDTAVSEDEWEFACRCFLKRHLLAHKMGVIDEQYLNESRDAHAIVGRKVSVQPDEVRQFVQVIRQLGKFLIDQLHN